MMSADEKVVRHIHCSVINNEKLEYMRQAIVILSWILFSNITFSQIQNEEFDNWILIDTLGESYQDLINWETNNVNLGNGFATVPNFEIIEGNDTGVSITSNHQGIDGLSSGRISQTISSVNLVNINYRSKCDSLFDFGACVVNILDSANNIIYTDSLKQEESSYSDKVISINDLALNGSEIITVEFVAFGQLGEFETFQAYSEFNLLSVNSEYMTSTNDQYYNNSTVVYPNPFSEYINFQTKSDMPIDYELFGLDGSTVKIGSGNNVQTTEIATGQYLIRISQGQEVSIKQIVKR